MNGKLTNQNSADQDKIDQMNDTINKIDKTNFDFLNSTDDENSFKPLDQKVKTNFSFLESDQSGDEEKSEKKTEKLDSDWTRTEKSDTQMSSDENESEDDKTSQSESENPFLKNLMAAQKAQNRSRSDSESSSISSNYSQSKVSHQRMLPMM